MKWFQGTVTEAIADSKARSCLFVVYAEDGGDLSLRMENLVWDSTSVCELMNGHVILKLSAGSDSLFQFSQLYPVGSFPTTFFISPFGGHLVDIVVGFLPENELLKRALAATQKLKSSDADSAAVGGGSMGTFEGKGSDSVGDTSVSPSAVEPAPLSKEEKIAKAQSLLQAQKQKRQEALQMKDQQDEINRRELGHGLNEFTRKQKQREAAERLKELQKERQESIKAREEIRRKIAQDRAERAGQKDKYSSASLSSETSPASLTSARQPSLNSDQTCLQFRLPDGSSVTEQFSSATTLESARQFIAAKIEDRWPHFGLVCTYPRHELGLDLDSQSLVQLGLSPRAAILVVAQSLPEGSSLVGNSSSWILRLFMLPLLLLQAAWQWLTSAISPSPQSSQSLKKQYHQPSPEKARVSRGWSSYQDGHVRRLKTDDDDDDMNTWNGNSTQQQ